MREGAYLLCPALPRAQGGGGLRQDLATSGIVSLTGQREGSGWDGNPKKGV